MLLGRYPVRAKVESDKVAFRPLGQEGWGGMGGVGRDTVTVDMCHVCLALGAEGWGEEGVLSPRKDGGVVPACCILVEKDFFKLNRVFKMLHG